MIRHPSARTLPLALLLLWAPLPFASVSLAARSWLALAAALVLALALWTEAPSRSARAGALAGAALAAVALWGLLQSLPWPSSLASMLSSEHARLARSSAEALGEEPPGTVRLSLAPASSRLAALDWLTGAAVLGAAALLGRSRRARRLLGAAILASGLFQLFFGAQRWLARSTSLWGVDLPDFGSRLRGTFVNPNNAALYLELALAVAFAWGWWSLRRAARERSAELRLLRGGLPALAWLALFVGLAFTRSRAGLLAALVVVALQGAAIGSHKRRLWLAASGLVAGLAGIALVSYLGFQQGLGRLLGAGGDRLQSGGRIAVALATVDLWARFPITGTGLGSFRATYPMVQTAATPGDWRHAHSEPIELAATTGLVGLAICAAGLFLIAARLRRVLLDGERSEDRAAALAALGALASALLHGLFDFGLTLPANAVTLAAIAGAASAARLAPEKEGRPA